MNTHLLITILIVVLIFALISSIPRWPHSVNWGWSPATIVLVIILILLIAGCANLPKPPPTLTIHQRYEIACVSGGTAYGVITMVNNLHPLTASQQAQALKAKQKVDKRCKLAPGQDYPYTALDAVMTDLEGAAATLNRIKGEVQP